MCIAVVIIPGLLRPPVEDAVRPYFGRSRMISLDRTYGKLLLCPWYHNGQSNRTDPELASLPRTPHSNEILCAWNISEGNLAQCIFHDLCFASFIDRIL